MHSKFIAHILG